MQCDRTIISAHFQSKQALRTVVQTMQIQQIPEKQQLRILKTMALVEQSNHHKTQIQFQGGFGGNFVYHSSSQGLSETNKGMHPQRFAGTKIRPRFSFLCGKKKLFANERNPGRGGSLRLRCRTRKLPNKQHNLRNCKRDHLQQKTIQVTKPSQKKQAKNSDPSNVTTNFMNYDLGVCRRCFNLPEQDAAEKNSSNI